MAVMIPSLAAESLEGKVVLVTGAASGIGEATALLAATRGASVVIADLNVGDAEALAAKIGENALHCAVDVSSAEDMRKLFDRAVTRFGRVTSVVNNAGMIVTKSLVTTTVEEWDRCMAVNARGVFLGCKYAVEHFLAREGGGAIVNTASISALVGLRDQPAYCASKGAVLQLTKQIAVDYSAQGVRCNSVGPGAVETAVLKSYFDGQSDPGAARIAMGSTHPIGRLGQPIEIAAAICFLLSDAASFITGANLQVDGGYTAA